MILAIILLFIISAIIIFATIAYKKNIQLFISTLISVLVLFSIVPFVIKPALHKPFSVSIIDYIIKFNTDGSVTTTKQTTPTVLKEDNN